MKRRESKLPWGRAAAGAVLCTVVGCAHRPVAVPPLAGQAPKPQVSRSENLERLIRVYNQRTAAAGDGDYVLGPGDVLEIRAFDLEEMNQQRVRVDGDGTITLPLLNAVPVAGFTVTQVQRELTRRLGTYMYHPALTVFVEEYRSQQVAVVGAVSRPGLVSQTFRNSTILDAISAVGGLTAQAGSRIYLIPAENRGRPESQGAELAMRDADPSSLDDAQLHGAAPIVTDTAEPDEDVQRYFFTVPVRGGDVIMVPNIGHFIVGGWVEKPGTYPVQQNLTLRGAIAIAGGLSFPASRHIRLYRPAASGQTEVRAVNYGDIAAQRAPDVALHEGDVVEVPYSIPKLIPYGAYKVIADLFHLGAGVRVAP